MKTLIIVPNSNSGLLPKVEDGLIKVAKDDHYYRVENLPGAPLAIESHADEALAAPFVVERVKRAGLEDYNAVLVNCFGSPGVAEAQALVSIPVVDGFISAIEKAHITANRIGILALGRTHADKISKNLKTLNQPNCTFTVRQVDRKMKDIGVDPEFATLLASHCRELVQNYSMEAIVFGCMGMGMYIDAIRRDLARRGIIIPLIDPDVAGVQALEYMARGEKHPELK